MKQIVTLLFCILCIETCLISQNTVGLISYDLNRIYDGYSIMYPHNQPHVYLLNNCGQIVHIWEDAVAIRPGNTVYLCPNGDLVKCSRHNVVTDDVIWAGGGGEFVEIRAWDNTLKWRYTLNDSLQRLHHDIAPMPNGNILVLAWERKLYDEAIAAGRDSTKLTKGEIWSEAVLEIKPDGDTFEIVWSWHVWDHLVQDFDSTKANYGVVSEYPGRININWGSNEGTSSWMHANAIDYNPILDQILISIPTFDEIWIIDHSTTTEQAAGSTGGKSGVGGELMFRWGNPAVYDRGGPEHQRLFFQHDAHWIDAHLDETHPHFGKIAVYNNRVGADSSQIAIINPLFLDYGWMYGMDQQDRFLPQEFDWAYSHPDKSVMFSAGLSSVQFLPNENILICNGNRGYTFEITPWEEIVWEYRTPLRQGARVAQGTTLQPNENQTFRMHRYPVDHPAFAGRDLSPKGYIELNPDTTFCDLTSGTQDPAVRGNISVFPNPASDQLFVTWEDPVRRTVSVTDYIGRNVLSAKGYPGYARLDVSNLVSGWYVISVQGYPSRPLIVHR